MCVLNKRGRRRKIEYSLCELLSKTGQSLFLYFADIISIQSLPPTEEIILYFDQNLVLTKLKIFLMYKDHFITC